MTIFITVLAFGAGFLVVFAINMMYVDLWAGQREQLRERLASDLRAKQRARAQDSLDKKELYELAVAGSVDLSSRITLRERLDRLVDQSGVKMKPQQVTTLVLIVALACDSVVSATLGWVPGVIAALVGGAIPLAYISVLRNQRLRKLQSQLPEVFETMSRMLRAGRTIPQALQAVGEEFPRPASEEFGYAYEQQNLGLSPEAAMKDLARRTGLLELKIFVMAVMIHQQTGGNLADLLDKLADMVRGRFRILGMIRALTGEGRMQALILLMLPPFLLVAICFINRPYAMVLFEYPLLLVGMFSFMAFGALWMHKIIHFDF